eukprot:6228480-Alexandrium_andersonii.AAC.1
MTSKLTWWQPFYAQLKNAEALLTNADRMRVVVDKMIPAQEGPSTPLLFKEVAPKLHEQRWLVIVSFMRFAKPRLL